MKQFLYELIVAGMLRHRVGEGRGGGIPLSASKLAITGSVLFHAVNRQDSFLFQEDVGASTS